MQLIPSVISATCTAGSLVTGFGAVTTVPLGFISVASGCVGILLGIFDQKALKKMKKHSKLVQLATTLNSEIIQKYLNDQQITKEEFSEVLKLLEKLVNARAHALNPPSSLYIRLPKLFGKLSQLS